MKAHARKLALVVLALSAGCEAEVPCTSQNDCKPGEGCTGDHTCAPGQLPTVVAPAPLELEAGKSATFLITGQDTQSAPGELTIRITQQPTLGTLTGGGAHPPAQYTYTPSPGQSGEDHITFEIVDPHGNVSTPVAVALNIAPPPAPAEPTAQTIEKPEKTTKKTKAGKKAAAQAERRNGNGNKKVRKASAETGERPQKAAAERPQKAAAERPQKAAAERPQKAAKKTAKARPSKKTARREVADARAPKQRGGKKQRAAARVADEDTSPSLAKNDAQADTRVNDQRDLPVEQPAPGGPVEVSWFAAAPGELNPGEASELTWEAAGASECSIDGGTAQPAKGKLSVTPSSTHVYELHCTGPDGEATAKANIKVLGKEEPVAYAPAIEKFEAVKAAVASGDEATLVWSSSHTSGCELDGGVGVVAGSGEATVKPVSTTTYSLVCHSTMGDVTSRTTVTVMEDAPMPWGLVAILSSVAMGSAGATILAITSGDEDKIRNNEFRDFASANSSDKASTFSRVESAVNKHNTRVVIGWSLVGLALAGTGVAAVLYSSDDNDADVSVGVEAAPAQAGLWLRGRF